ncbi:MAG: AarF/ABC1/UbiB kinase family protein [Clostridia bacterium]|nr:AarF/ABC1/UbiB kinase family protein [Deltaproteobacteria bacterium]
MLVGLAANLARKEVGNRLRSAITGDASDAKTLAVRIEQAKLLVEDFGRLKGAVMKAGQLLSMDAGDLVPPEVVAVLEKLQANAEIVPFATMRQVLLDEIGPEKLARLENIEEVPAASASIGQVYRAYVDGNAVAVKVQYPGVAESIDSDLVVLRKLGHSLITLSGRKMKLDAFTEELGRVLHFEADYERERAYMDRFARALAADARYCVPQSCPELSTNRVLTMSWEEGVPFAAYVKTPHPRATREAIGHALLDLFFTELFDLGVVQTDPNFANFLVRENGPCIVLLDFGASVEFDPEFRSAYVELVRSIASGDAKRIVDSAIAFGVIDPREKVETLSLFTDLLIHAFVPFREDRQPFAFSDKSYLDEARVQGERFTRELLYSAPPKQLVFLHRKLGGLFVMLKQLDVALDLRPYADRLMGA